MTLNMVIFSFSFELKIPTIISYKMLENTVTTKNPITSSWDT